MCSCDLLRFANSQPHTRIGEVDASVWSRQLVGGLRDLHNLGILHRDVKPENLLLTADGCLKIADFGWCANIRDGPTSLAGTFVYMAPEMLAEAGPQTEAIDVWSAGITIIQLLTGSHFLKTYLGAGATGLSQKDQRAATKKKTQMLLLEIESRCPPPHETKPPQLSWYAWDWLRLLLVPDVNRRANTTTALAHNWIAKAAPFDSARVEPDPERSPTSGGSTHQRAAEPPQPVQPPQTPAPVPQPAPPVAAPGSPPTMGHRAPKEGQNAGFWPQPRLVVRASPEATAAASDMAVERSREDVARKIGTSPDGLQQAIRVSPAPATSTKEAESVPVDDESYRVATTPQWTAAAGTCRAHRTSVTLTQVNRSPGPKVAGGPAPGDDTHVKRVVSPTVAVAASPLRSQPLPETRPGGYSSPLRPSNVVDALSQSAQKPEGARQVILRQTPQGQRQVVCRQVVNGTNMTATTTNNGSATTNNNNNNNNNGNSSSNNGSTTMTNISTNNGTHVNGNVHSPVPMISATTKPTPTPHYQVVHLSTSHSKGKLAQLSPGAVTAPKVVQTTAAAPPRVSPRPHTQYVTVQTGDMNLALTRTHMSGTRSPIVQAP
eukprot:CAMPEP_0206483390 /NCGR_PEP_ID=MMETSP0324_2-20121206/39399_1 /ASSEMBLY_ACC=CAM_ASM_000836 /TAXON_ID=2866 /ORGANISM="Crypthecodinium cohnii, Strain Seligo" /LENGTH=603 /DNA_ID=CAMNT_0053961435 /DNA_START=1 /DNA_END=1813 /DNA_ORIENTATION=-